MFRKRQDGSLPTPKSSSRDATLPEDTVKWKQLVRLRNTNIAIWLVGLVSNLPVPFLLMALFPSLKDLAILLMGALFACWVGACGVLLLLPDYLDRQFQHTMDRNDIASLGCWIDMMFSPTCKVAYPLAVGNRFSEVRSRLLEHLPMLTQDTAYLLRSDERLALYKTLCGTDVGLVRVVLETIPVLGDARAMPFVQFLVEGKGLAGSYNDVQVQAQSTLIALQAQIALSSGVRGLLRASQPPLSLEKELLIPTYTNSDTEGKELLRADMQV